MTQALARIRAVDQHCNISRLPAW